MIKLLNGYQAVTEALIYSGVKYFYSSPILPNNRLLLYTSRRFRELNRICIQTNNDKETLGRFIGAGSVGVKLSASNDVLKEELLEYSEFPSLIIDISDTFNNLYNKFITIIPFSVQSIYDLTIEAFKLSQIIKKTVILKIETIFSDIYSDLELFEDISFAEKIYSEKINTPHCIYETYETNDSSILILAYGFISEIIKDTILFFRKKDIKVGLIKIITLNPFPLEEIKQLIYKNNKIIIVNLSFINFISEKIYHVNESNFEKIIEIINNLLK